MNLVRTFGTIAMTAALAACSGNLGGGQSTLPGTPQSGGGNSNIQQVAQAAPTPTPNSDSNVATYGVAGPQSLPAIDGWGGSIAFASASAAPAAVPNEKASPSSAAASGVSIGVTSSVVDPPDAPRFNPAGKHHARAGAPTGLFFVTLLATADVSLEALPQIAVYVPRDVAAKYRGETFALALYDPDTKAKAYRLDVAQRDLTAPQTGSLPPPPAATPVPSPSPSSSAMLFPMPGMSGSLTPPPIATAAPTPHSALPPEEIAFLPTAAKLTLHENEAVFFALYVIAPAAKPSPSPSPSPSPKHPAPTPPGSSAAIPSAAPSTAAAASPTPTPAVTPAHDSNGYNRSIW